MQSRTNVRNVVECETLTLTCTDLYKSEIVLEVFKNDVYITTVFHRLGNNGAEYPEEFSSVRITDNK
jgi:hypothetical protein